jgi:DNA invertase Pin-like site-specific DNA recombinase
VNVGYARVSTLEQSVEIQIDALTAAGCEQIFSEKVSGSSTTDRDELARALQFVRAGDVLMVTRLDRLARSMVDLTRIVADLTQRGVGFKCVQQAAVDTTDLQGRLMLNILGAFAEFETDLRRARQAEGIARAKARGVYSGKAPKVSEIDIRALRSEGLSAPEIAARLRCSKRTVYRYTPGCWAESPFEGQ